MISATTLSPSYASCYDRTRAGLDAQSVLVESIIQDYFGGRESISILDLGSGPGRLAVPLAKAGHRLVCVDMDPDALSNLRSRASAADIEVITILGSIESLEELQLGEFDVILMFHVIHWLGTLSILDTVGRFLTKGGCLVLSYFDSKHLADMLFYRIAGDHVLHIQQDLTPTSSDMTVRLAECGFSLIQRTELRMSVDYGHGMIEEILNCAGTYALRTYRKQFGETAYAELVDMGLQRTAAMKKLQSGLLDNETRTVLVLGAAG